MTDRASPAARHLRSSITPSLADLDRLEEKLDTVLAFIENLEQFLPRLRKVLESRLARRVLRAEEEAGDTPLVMRHGRT